MDKHFAQFKQRERHFFFFLAIDTSQSTVDSLVIAYNMQFSSYIKKKFIKTILGVLYLINDMLSTHCSAYLTST